MTRFQTLRFRQLVMSRAEQLGYCRLTQLQLARTLHPCGSHTLRAQAHQVVPYPYESATTTPGAA